MRIGFTCSAFDLLHAGHISMLEEAKSVCDYLIVGLQTDPSLDGRKPKPVQSVYERYLQLSGCKYVDKIIPYDTETDLINLLLTQKIDIRIVGSDYIGKTFTGSDLHSIHFNRRDHTWSSTWLKERVCERGIHEERL